MDIYLDKVQTWLTRILCEPLFLLLLPSTDQHFKPFAKFSPHLTVGRTTQRWSVTSSLTVIIISLYSRPVRQELSLILDAK